MENQAPNSEKRNYIRLSEIPKEHLAFTRTCEAIQPEGERELCYLLQDYERWLEQWEDEGGRVGPNYDTV